MLENGSVVESGTYNELRKRDGGVFNEFVKSHLDARESYERQDSRSQFLWDYNSTLMFNCELWDFLDDQKDVNDGEKKE